jgi:metallo-beta-lactamase family protein
MDAGHILGSAFIELWVEDEGGSSKVVFSGDLGRSHQLLVNDPSAPGPGDTADFLLLESTYGDRNHKDEEKSRDELAAAIAYSYGNREKVIIPAFAVERTQEVIYTLHLLAKDGRLPPDMPVFLDSPMAIRATEVFRRHPEFLDPDTRKILDSGESPLDLPNLRPMPTTDDSMAINAYKGPAIVISASGMANAGRVKHHLRHNLWKRGASVVFVGYQAKGTTGRKIVDGATRVNLLGDDVAVKAKVFTIGGFSAHAGQSQLLDWVSTFKNPNMEIFLVHGENSGENSAQTTLAGLIRRQFGFKVQIPQYLEEFTLKPGQVLGSVQVPEKATPRIDWDLVLTETETKVAALRERLGQIQSRPWVDQTEIRDRLLGVNSRLMELLSDL